MQHGGLDARRGQAGDETLEEVELPLGVGTVLGLLAVGNGQVRPDALEMQHRLARTAAAIAGKATGSAPTRCMPVSTLTWTATGRPAARADAAQASIAWSEYRVGVSP